MRPARLAGMTGIGVDLRLIGWRVGWIAAPERVVPDIALVSMGNVVVPVGIAQAAAAVALEAGDGDVARATAIWQERRDVILGELAGLPVVRPAGGWSLLIDGAPLGMTGAELSWRLFDGARIAATPMDGWGEVNGAQLLRLVFANEPVDRLRGIGERVRRALSVRYRADNRGRNPLTP